ncbi:hypothetical protein [Roseibium sp. RKSG952]|uniref:hypothetical protein n=1 Tax=Roseibium sp. RKSG952 TaxID=2529384 RepID=UPI0012BC3CC1|nr:hypothetical protein [Roseibium sp. RKSG952]MTH95049.1 hypothetical protein [Roseibium sp. RKSG952]
MPTFADITEAITSERRYQDSRWGDTKFSARPDNGERSIDEFILCNHGYGVDADTAGENQEEVVDVMHIVRKAAGLWRACLEQHGDPEGVIYKESECGVAEFAIDDFSQKTIFLVHTGSHFGDTSVKLAHVVNAYEAFITAMMNFGSPLREA